MNREEIKNLLLTRQIRPSKGLGQNFLVDKRVLKQILDAANLQKDDIVLEIGPGVGTLTQELAKRAKKVVAVEKDKKMVAILQETMKDYGNIEIINADILKLIPNNQTRSQKKYPTKNNQNLSSGVWDFFRNSGLRIGHYKVVANLPYYITSPFIRKFLERKNPPSEMILMVQKEVAQRICAKPPEMSLLAVSVQFYAKPKIIFYVSKKSFWPQPKVDGAVIRIEPRVGIDKRQIDAGLFFRVVKAGFSQPRKQLVNNLAKSLKLDKIKTGEWLSASNIQPAQRAETLNVGDWINLANSL